MARAQTHIEKQRMRAKLRNKLEQEKVKLKSTLNTELCNQKVRVMERERMIGKEKIYICSFTFLIMRSYNDKSVIN